MDLLYFFSVGVIFTLMSLDNNNALKSKDLLCYKDKKAPGFKIFYDILIAWFFAGNALFFLYLWTFVMRVGISDASIFVRIIILSVFLINTFIMPFVLFKRVLVSDKNKGYK
jgi:hypothetical protein